MMVRLHKLLKLFVRPFLYSNICNLRTYPGAENRGRLTDSMLERVRQSLCRREGEWYEKKNNILADVGGFVHADMDCNIYM